MPTMSARRPASVSIRSAAAAEQQRRARPLHRLGQPVEPGDRGSGRRATVHGPSPHRPSSTSRASASRRDPRAGRIEGDAGGVVVGGHPAGADADLDAAAGQDVEVATSLASTTGWR